MKTKLLKKDFHQMVLEEANHLRKHATDEEKSNLDFDNLDILSPRYCIYGKMTGNCDSNRAIELYKKTLGGVQEEFKSFSEYKDHGTFEGSHYQFRTPIEIYITIEGSKNEQLIKYIKGEIDSFKP